MDIEQARTTMIAQQIRPWQVFDHAVLDILARVHREDFVPPTQRAYAFMDLQIPLHEPADEARAKGQVMLEPRVEARLLLEAAVQPSDRVLEIGTGSGYMAALLAQQAREVVTLEIEPTLVQAARVNLERCGIGNVRVRQGDAAAFAGTTEKPFDVIVFSGSVPELPEDFLKLLTPAGRLIAVIGEEPIMRTTVIQRRGDKTVRSEPWDVLIPPLIGFTRPAVPHAA